MAIFIFLHARAGAAGQQSQRKPLPSVLFTIASAGSEVRLPEGVPAWRVAVGNLAAGATAGCAVEAGESCC